MHYCDIDKTLHDEDEGQCTHKPLHDVFNEGFAWGLKLGRERDITGACGPGVPPEPRDKLSLTIGRRVTDEEWRKWLKMR